MGGTPSNFLGSQLLRVAQVGVHDNFFELGGHSLLAMQLLARAHAATGVAVPLLKFFESPTVAEMARFIETAHTGSPAPPAIPAVARRPSAPASLAQEALWALARMHPGRTVSSIAYAVRLQGPLDPGLLQRSIEAVVQRHEALRTTLKVMDGRLVQVIAATMPVPLAIVDLRARPAARREAESRRLAQAVAREPFDLRRGPLVRVRGWRVGDEEHVLLLAMHHAVGDGWSMGILIRELAAAYGAYAAGQPVALPPLPIQYADYAQRAGLQRLVDGGGTRRPALAAKPRGAHPHAGPRDAARDGSASSANPHAKRVYRRGLLP